MQAQQYRKSEHPEFVEACRQEMNGQQGRGHWEFFADKRRPVKLKGLAAQPDETTICRQMVTVKQRDDWSIVRIQFEQPWTITVRSHMSLWAFPFDWQRFKFKWGSSQP
eukprot:gb/GFBE01042510.1/.p1 GENE.gb/GFBE01042510.1/~~gb/GFBE01042510.1/.p1  ORF type:complete len:109 (+),score=14.80 gb/GFBE01042510.1/:1-327(+)